MKKRVLLLILDGFGINESTPHENSIIQAKPEQILNTLLSHPHYTRLEASGRAVGLLDGFMGNSEVGHMTIGSGQIIKQSLLEINDAFESGEFSTLPAWEKLISLKTPLHIVGMLGFAGVHAYQKHLYEIIKIIPTDRTLALHLFTDGRDSGIMESLSYLRELEAFISPFPNVSIASISGRYYAMDRDNNWSRTESAYHALLGKNVTNLSPCEYVENCYAHKQYDEFIEPISFAGKPSMHNGDTVFVFNFRPDRGRQITELLTGDNETGGKIKVSVFSMTKFYDSYSGEVLIERKKINTTLGSIISSAGLTQLHLAETEKFAHVTQFFNGIRSEPFPLEDDIIVPSHKVEGGYESDPEMSAYEILAVFKEKALEYDFNVVNLANGDMVGHSGKLDAGKKAVRTLDSVVKEFIEICKQHDMALCITADHGNCEEMGDYENPKTSHTTNDVPFWYIANGKIIDTKPTGGLVDVAPTILDIMGLREENEMSGKSLLTTHSFVFG